MIRTANLTASISRNAGGLFESVRQLVQSLAALGMEVSAYGVQDEFTQADIDAWHPVQVRAFRPTWPAQFNYAPGYTEELIAFKPDITHTHGLWVYPSIATNIYCRRNRSPYLISAHGMLDPWAIRHSRWRKAISYFLYEESHLRGAHCLRALCESEARSIRELGLKNPIAIIPNGIDLPSNPPTHPPSWHGIIEPGKKVLLFLSRIHPKKGLVNLVKAWSAVRKSGGQGRKSDWVLAIAGWDQGGHEDELKRLCGELQVPFGEAAKPNADAEKSRINFSDSGSRQSATPPSVIFLGPQFGDAKAACYTNCDAFILPSFSEGLPMVVLEAWAHSKPVLMTPQCNLPEGFSAKAALRIEPSPSSLAEGLEALFRLDESELAALGNRGFALAADRFTWPRIALQMKDVYEWMLGGGSKPACLASF